MIEHSWTLITAFTALSLLRQKLLFFFFSSIIEMSSNYTYLKPGMLDCSIEAEKKGCNGFISALLEIKRNKQNRRLMWKKCAALPKNTLFMRGGCGAERLQQSVDTSQHIGRRFYFIKYTQNGSCPRGGRRIDDSVQTLGKKHFHT